jgi:SusD/RagB-like outer membrane lipoprotein
MSRGDINLMRTRQKHVVALAGFALLAAMACNNDKLTEINRNPNSPEDVPAASIFTTAARTATQNWVGNFFNLRGTEWVAQHLAEVQYPDEDDYKRLQGSQTTALFDNPYVGELEDLRKVIDKGQADKDPGIYAPALVLRTWDFSHMTNTFGDIPYFEALAGDSVGSTLSPKYDAQKDIYADFFKVLDDASKSLSSASNSFGKADPIYGGDPKKWQKFANSLRLRLAMQIVNVDPATASTQVAAALAAPGGVFTSNADMALFAWPGDGVYNNPWSGNFQTRDDHRMSQTLMNIMLASSDPRIPVFAQPTLADPTKYAGMPNGLSQATASAYFNISSRPGKIFWPSANASGVTGGTGITTPSYLMTYAEVAFLEAEAAARGIGGLTSGQAQGFYNAGITASLNQWGITDAAKISAFLANANIAYKGGVAGQTQIATQEWVALFTDGTQAWALWRRTCAPATLKPGPFAIISTVPRRFEYSDTEKSTNADQVSAALSQMGASADDFTTRMYWDKNPTAAPTFVTGCGQR